MWNLNKEYRIFEGCVVLPVNFLLQIACCWEKLSNASLKKNSSVKYSENLSLISRTLQRWCPLVLQLKEHSYQTNSD